MSAIKRQFPIWTGGGRLLLLLVLLIGSALVTTTTASEATVEKLRGESATLSCPIDAATCGELHSVKWFKGTDRVAVVSGDGSVQNVESAFSGKVSIEHKSDAATTNLHIKSVQVPDEDVYVCETTFLEPLETCTTDGTFSVKLLIIVPPTTIQMLDESNAQIPNTTTLGPLREGHRFTSTCEVRNTRPAPLVGWYRADKKLTAAVTQEEQDGLFTVKAVLSLMLSRQELDSYLECRVETRALSNVVRNQIHIDLQVRPTKVELAGVKHHAVQDTYIVLKCLVTGARPAANVTWYNNTIALDPEVDSDKRAISTVTEFRNDGTYETLSKIEFTATRFENGITIRCEADNIVMREDSDKPIHDTMTLEVMYPPVVSVKPDNLTVNEGDEFLLFCEYEANPATLKQVRWLKDGDLISLNQTRVEGGNPEQNALLIKNATRTDIGSYKCELTNGIGEGASDNDIDVDVLFAPVVELLMDPESPLKENDKQNLTLTCAVIDGNPRQLLEVRWFFGDEILIRNETDDDYNDDDECCTLVLSTVNRTDGGNYSCQGQNSAGWGQRSANNLLDVYYEPGEATLQHSPLVPTKKKSVTLTCSVDDGGNPNATRYRWQRGETPILDVVTPTWTVDPVGLESRTNFTCFAYNEGGEGTAATVLLDVHAPQQFLERLPPYTGALHTADTVELACRVECRPSCTIAWSVAGREIIDEENDRYWVEVTEVPANGKTGDFESVLSVLHFNVSAWPEGRLLNDRDNANYTCESSSVNDGIGVRSTTMFAVEYPPENTVISHSIIYVEEGLQPPRVTCSAHANPEATYEWRRKDRIISRQNVLILSNDVTRADDGIYFCEATNKHGMHSASTQMNVQFKPNCTITRKTINDEDTLVCVGIGNPSLKMEFAWSVQEQDSNETSGDLQGRDSYDDLPANLLAIEADVSTQRVYRCVATNAVGTGLMCDIKVDGYLMWWQKLEPMMQYILLGVAVAVLLIIIILIIVCCCCCGKSKDPKKKNAADKAAANPQESIDMHDDGEYENLPFHGMQSPPSKPLCVDDELEYADVDFRSYGPINYKAASIYALVKKNKSGPLLEK